MAIIAGLVAAVDAPWRRKLGVLALVLPVIHVLNIARNTFISISLGEQLFQVFPEVVMGLFSLQDAEMVSYIVADRIISQGLSVVVLVALVVLIVRRLPEVLTVVEDGLFLVTGRDYELADALGVDRP
jgi:archaeosortase A (PGF-CTERM-specific)